MYPFYYLIVHKGRSVNNTSYVKQLAPTPLRRLRSLPSCELFLKDESVQPYSGTHKARKAVAGVHEGLLAGVTGLGVITAGNMGIAAALAAKKEGIKVCAIVPHDVSVTIEQALEKAGAFVELRDLSEYLSPAQVIEITSKHIHGRIHDVTDGCEWAYAPMVDELYDTQPDAIVCQIGTGQLFSGLAEGIRRNGMRTRLVGVQPEREGSIAKKLDVRWRAYQHRIDYYCMEYNHALLSIPEDEIRQAVKSVPKGIRCEPSAAIVFAALPYLEEEGFSKAVLINTGCGVQ